MEEHCNYNSQKIIEQLIKCKINLLAIDFDNTFISIHTGGVYQGTEHELVKSVRPIFRHLVPLALSRGILVAIVTFSPQTDLIGETLKIQFPDTHAQLVIRGNDNSWQYVGLGSTAGKQAHMASAAHELAAKHGVDITRKSTLLIDDDVNNIRAALKNKTPAVLFRPDDVTLTVTELQSIQVNVHELAI